PSRIRSFGQGILVQYVVPRLGACLDSLWRRFCSRAGLTIGAAPVRILMNGVSYVMSKVRVQSFALSIDGYGAGPSQDRDNPLGVNGPELMEFFLHPRVWRRMHGHADGETGIDNDMAELGFTGV